MFVFLDAELDRFGGVCDFFTHCSSGYVCIEGLCHSENYEPTRVEGEGALCSFTIPCKPGLMCLEGSCFSFGG